MKRGLGHVEFVVSFVLFVGFLVFAFYFFSPLEGNRIIDSTLFYTMDEIYSNSSVIIETLSVVISEEVSESLIAIPVDNRQNMGVYIEDSKGNPLAGKFNPLTEIVHIERGEERFFIIKFSEVLGKGNLNDGILLTQEEFFISSSDSLEVVSEKRVEDIFERYEGDGYLELREAFNLPARANFGFRLVLSDNTIEALNPVPEGLEVYSETRRVEVLRLNGASEFGDLEVRIW